MKISTFTIQPPFPTQTLPHLAGASRDRYRGTKDKSRRSKAKALRGYFLRSVGAQALRGGLWQALRGDLLILFLKISYLLYVLYYTHSFCIIVFDSVLSALYQYSAMERMLSYCWNIASNN